MGKIKVLTACGLKHEKYLDSCKESVAANSVPHEHLVAIGDSMKGTMMNRLLKEVDDNDIVCLLDADDLADPNWLDNAKYLDHYDLIYGDTWNINKDGSGERYVSKEFNWEEFQHKNFIPYSGVMLVGWLAKEVPYPNLVHAADWYYWHQLLQHSVHFGYIDKVFTTRRMWTGYRRSNIPVYRKLRRLYREYKVKKLIKAIRTDN